MCNYPFQVGDVLATRPEPSLVLKKEDEGLLLKMGDQYIWALGADMDVDVDGNWKIVWEQAYYFDDFKIVPELKELTQYDNYTAVLSNSLWYIIDDQNRALLSNSAFLPDELPQNRTVVVPPFIHCNNQRYEVTGVSDWACYKNKQIINMKLPDSVTNIGKHAFTGAILKNISFPKKAFLGENSFYGCNDLVLNIINQEDREQDTQFIPKSEYQTFGEFLNSSQELDCDLIIGKAEMPATFVWSASDSIKEYGYEKFKSVLDCSYEVLENGNISIDDGNEKVGEDFVLAAAGYISDNEYQKMFQSNDDHENNWDLAR